jgi:hypothetical protein
VEMTSGGLGDIISGAWPAQDGVRVVERCEWTLIATYPVPTPVAPEPPSAPRISFRGFLSHAIRIARFRLPRTLMPSARINPPLTLAREPSAVCAEIVDEREGV